MKIGIIGLVIERIFSYPQRIENEGSAQIACAADSDESLRVKAQAKFGLDKSKVYSDYNEMLEKEKLDVVFIFAEPTLHAKAAIASARKGLHIYVEKPMCLSAKEANDMIEAAKNNNVKLMVNAPYAYDRHMKGLYTDIIENKKIGDITTMFWKGGNAGPKGKCTPQFYAALNDPKRGGGALIDYAPYGGIFFSHYLGGLPDKVYAQSANLGLDNYNVEDYVVINLFYKEKGVFCKMDCSWIEEVAGGMFFNISGTKGALFHNQASQNQESPYSSMDYYYKLKNEVPIKAQPEKKTDAEGQSALHYFFHCIKNNEEIKGMTSPECARDAQIIIDAAFESIKTNKEIIIKK